MIRIQVHASLLDYLTRLQLEAQGEEVPCIPVSCFGRVAVLRPSQLREELLRISPGTSWVFNADHKEGSHAAPS